MERVLNTGKPVAIVILNWNGWRDTVECLDSLLRLSRVEFRIVVVDNDSSDGSVAAIEDWARAANLSRRLLSVEDIGKDKINEPLTIIRSDENRGFAGGVNLGLRHAAADPAIGHFWLLNNDTVVDSDAAAALLDRTSEDDSVGLCGSRIMWFDDRSSVQTLGGRQYEWDRAWGHAIVDHSLSSDEVEKAMSYVSGASMFATRAFVEKVGLLSENYFLYFEEIDWVMRSHGQFRIAYSPASVVYHKEGRSIGSSSRERPSNLSLRYLERNRLRFTRAFAPERLWRLRKHMMRETISAVRRLDVWAAGFKVQAIASDLFRKSR